MHLHLFLSAAIIFLVTAGSAAESERGKRLVGQTSVSDWTKYNFFVDVWSRDVKDVNNVTVDYYREGSGVLYNAEYALTVAHDLVSDGSYRQVRCGSNVRNVSKAIIHPSFNKYSLMPLLPNDLAILKLDSPMPLDNNCQPAKLISGPMNFWTLRVAGRGYVSGSTNMTFVEAKMSALHRATCTLSYGFFVNGNIQLCGKDFHQVARVCKDDAGVPALIGDTVVGLASWTDPFCQWPAVFTRLSSFVDWVHTTISNEQNSG